MDLSIKDRVLSVMSEVLALETNPAMEDRLREDLEVNSLDTVTLILELEEEFGGKIDEDRIEVFGTVGDIVDYINHQLTGEAAVA